MPLMPKLIPVPWMRWKRFRVEGQIVEAGTERPLAGLRVQAFDKDLLSDDFLGETVTDDEGRFEIRFTDDDFKDLTESRPDLYLCVFAPDSETPLVDQSGTPRTNASEEESFRIEIPAGALD